MLKAWVNLRWRILAEEPWCRHCKRDGRRRIATEIDHIYPLNRMSLENMRANYLDESNLQPLCRECHLRKSADERSGRDVRPTPKDNDKWNALAKDIAEGLYA